MNLYVSDVCRSEGNVLFVRIRRDFVNPPCICLLGECQLHIPAKVYGSAHTCLLDCYENDGDLLR